MGRSHSEDTEAMTDYLTGRKLYGDDFSEEEIAAWYKDEEEGWAQLIANDRTGGYDYSAHLANMRYAYRYLPKGPRMRVLGFGSAGGEEFEPILGRIKELTIVDPSDSFVKDEIGGVPVKYLKPTMNGTLPFPDRTFDLITCFGVLHHIPNVSKVMNEFHRCLMPDGYLLLREPTVSLGDWRVPRYQATKRERGIPLGIFREIIRSQGLRVVHEQRCLSSITQMVKSRLNAPITNSRFVLFLDEIICASLRWNTLYHATNIVEKMRPAGVYYVLQRSNA